MRRCRKTRSSGCVFIAEHPGLIELLGQSVVAEYRYEVMVRKLGLLLTLTTVHPTRGVTKFEVGIEVLSERCLRTLAVTFNPPSGNLTARIQQIPEPD